MSGLAGRVSTPDPSVCNVHAMLTVSSILGVSSISSTTPPPQGGLQFGQRYVTRLPLLPTPGPVRRVEGLAARTTAESLGFAADLAGSKISATPEAIVQVCHRSSCLFFGGQQAGSSRLLLGLLQCGDQFRQLHDFDGDALFGGPLRLLAVVVCPDPDTHQVVAAVFGQVDVDLFGGFFSMMEMVSSMVFMSFWLASAAAQAAALLPGLFSCTSSFTSSG